jgi:2,4-dienoyl-CoA reductase-like NADH-dependent reductase (Old Yellow Enzyme family)/thioredoxin reductase
MVQRGQVTDQLLAYAERRARGGISLLITEAIGVHGESGYYESRLLMVDDDSYVEGLRKYAEVCHRNDCPIFGQLFHVGRYAHQARGGGPPVPYGPSAVPTEYYRATPRAMSAALIEEVERAYARGAARLARAGFDGVEILASHGYLPAQFLNPRQNRRSDAYGGSFENRLRFLREVIAAVRGAVGRELVVGIRISGDEMDYDGLGPDEIAQACATLDEDGDLDYFNVCAGSESTARGMLYYIPPMSVEPGYAAPLAKRVRDVVEKPVLVVGRINEAQLAARIVTQGQADMCGMARALICDPELPSKAEAGRLEDIRACIGCNQACIGRFSRGKSISCIQYPESGRELRYGERKPAVRPRRVLVVGGGPGGMKVAAVAAERGHSVTLCERAPRLGGQALLAQLLPGRAEFGGIVQNLGREVERAGVAVRTKVEVTRAFVESEKPDAVVLATGARPWLPEIEGAQEGHVVTAWQVLENEVEVGRSVLVADTRGDWIGVGIAELLAANGHRVRLSLTQSQPGQSLPDLNTLYYAIGQLASLGVEVIPNARLFGVDASTAYLQHTITSDPIECAEVDSVVLAVGHVPIRELEDELAGLDIEVISIGDCLAPRTAEQAVLEGLQVGSSI